MFTGCLNLRSVPGWLWKRASQRSRRDVVGEQDEERIVARQRAFLLAQARLVDGLGDDAGRAGRPGQHQGQAAPADRDGDVGEDALEPDIRRNGAPVVDATTAGGNVDVAVGAGRLDQPELGDVARDGRLGHGEALRAEGVDDLALAADRPRRDQLADGALALRLEVVAVLGGHRWVDHGPSWPPWPCAVTRRPHGPPGWR